MADYRLSQSGDEVQNILDNATPQSDLTSETERAIGAENQLQQNIDAEQSAREQADGTLQQHITELADQIAQTLNNYYRKSETMSAQEIQTLVSQTIAAYYTKLQVDALIHDFITASVDNLVNYYLKSETFTKDEVNQLIAAVKQFRYQSVPTLPTASADTMGIIYLVPSTNPKTKNTKDEFITTSSTNEQGVTIYDWEQIGTTTVDLSGYSTTEQMNAAISTAISTALASYYTKSETMSTAQINAAIEQAVNTALANYYTKAQTDAAISTALNTALASYYTKAETNGLLDTIRQSITAETGARTEADAALRQLINQVSASLVNYYLKTETYSKSEVQQLIDAVKQFQYLVVPTLPATPGPDTMGIIYLVPSTNPKTQNVKDEYITILDGSTYKWEHIGDTNIDLSGYSTTAEMNAAIASALTAYYTKTQVDGMVANINAALTAEVARAQQAEQANADAIAALQDIVADIETIAEGYVRVAGSSSPALSYKSYKYHEQGGFGRESVFSLFYPCLVGTPLTGSGTEGKVLHVLQKFGARTIDGSPKWLDIYGTPHAIDGSEGDVLIVNIEPFYSINGKHTIEGTEYDVFLMSRTPFTWQGIEAEHMEKFGWSPDYCVSHTDTDNVVRMHSVYNPAWNGSYQAPQGVAGKYVYSVDPETGDIVETYDANETLLGGAGGLHSTDLDLPTGEQRAMNNNADTTKTVPWMNQTAEGCNRLMSLILAEGGTFDAHNANLMGSGFSSNDPATVAGDWDQAGSGAKNGLRVMDKNGAWKYYGFNGNVRFLTGATSGDLKAGQAINAYRNPWHILEAHRAMSYAIENDVHELEWFVFEGNKYKYRSVQGFNGPSHGEMTCVVWKLMATQAGANAIDPSDNATNIAGNRVEILVSTALVHGMTTQVSPSWWTSGLLFTEDENGQYECFIERDQAELVKSIAADNYDPATPRDFETIYDHVLTVQKGEGYAKNYLNGAMMLPDSNANKTGAGLHTYVGKYNWFTGGNASAGKKSVRGFRRGYYAIFANLSPLAMNAYNSPSYTFSSIGFGTCCRIAE